MPVIGGGYDDRVEIFLVEHAAEISLPLRWAIELGQSRRYDVTQLLEMRVDPVELAVQVRLVDIAQGSHLGVLVGPEGEEHLNAAIANANAA